MTTPNIEQGLDGLSVRAANAVYTAGFLTKESTLAAIKSGDLHPRSNHRGYGWKTHMEVCKWVGYCAVCPTCNQALKSPLPNTGETKA